MSDRADFRVTKEIIDCVIEDVDKQNRSPRKKIVCGLKNHVVKMSTWGQSRSTFDEDTQEMVNCGTVGCLWGTAFLKANNYLTISGPCSEWTWISDWHFAMGKLFYLETLNNEELVIVYRAIDKDGFLHMKKLKSLGKSTLSEVTRKFSGYIKE